jgi:hypothetical protein
MSDSYGYELNYGESAMSTVTSTAADTVAPPKEVKQRIVQLLDRLPAESLMVLEQFVRFLDDQAQRGQRQSSVSETPEKSRFRYPTVPLPASFLDNLIGIMPAVGGDALADTEALYDEV